jgi:hypothetical protein
MPHAMDTKKESLLCCVASVSSSHGLCRADVSSSNWPIPVDIKWLNIHSRASINHVFTTVYNQGVACDTGTEPITLAVCHH